MRMHDKKSIKKMKNIPLKAEALNRDLVFQKALVISFLMVKSF